jgi:hypothetical protein
MRNLILMGAPISKRPMAIFDTNQSEGRDELAPGARRRCLGKQPVLGDRGAHPQESDSSGLLYNGPGSEAGPTVRRCLFDCRLQKWTLGTRGAHQRESGSSAIFKTAQNKWINATHQVRAMLVAIFTTEPGESKGSYPSARAIRWQFSERSR